MNILTHLLVDERGDWQAVEAVCEYFPQPDIVPPFALIVEAIDPVDGGALVVTPQQEKILRILDLRSDPQWRLKVGFSQRFAQGECCHFRAGAEELAKAFLKTFQTGIPYRPAAGRWSPGSACHGQRSPLGTGSWPPAGSRRTRTTSAGLNTAHGCRLRSTHNTGCPMSIGSTLAE